MKPLRIQIYLQFHSLIVVSRIVKNQKHQRETRIFRDDQMISVSYGLFYNSPNNSHNLMQVKIHRYQNSLLKKNQKLFLPLACSKFDESIISGTCFSSILSSHFLHLSLIKRWVRNIINFIIFKKISV